MIVKSPKIWSGSYKDELVFQAPVEAEDELGGSPEVPFTDATSTILGSIVPVSSSVAAYAQANRLQVTHEVECRYIEGFKASWRIKATTGSGVRYFKIIGARNQDERNRKLLLTCFEISTKEQTQ